MMRDDARRGRGSSKEGIVRVASSVKKIEGGWAKMASEGFDGPVLRLGPPAQSVQFADDLDPANQAPLAGSSEAAEHELQRQDGAARRLIQPTPRDATLEANGGQRL
jgi:hypothetical protein